MGLMRCLPDVDAPKGTRTLHPIDGRVPSPDNLPEGCIFSPRCEFARRTASRSIPNWKKSFPATRRAVSMREIGWKRASSGMTAGRTRQRSVPNVPAKLDRPC
jgi:oligopeptide/dipeptide ABC transporter ATP-binding protein